MKNKTAIKNQLFVSKRISLIVALLIFSFSILHSQTYDFAGMGGYKVSYSLNHLWDVSLTQDLRFNQNLTNYARFKTAVGVDYTLWRKKAKVGVIYSFINKENSDFYYDNRHRLTAQVSYRETFTKWRFSWRGRFQSTFRDEAFGDYKVNPKLYLRNRFRANYLLRGSRFKPFLSCELFYQLNNPDHNVIDQVRTEGGFDYVLTRNSSLEIFLRYDKEIQVRNPANVYMLGVFYKYDF